jgi:hypothetical protein
MKAIPVLMFLLAGCDAPVVYSVKRASTGEDCVAHWTTFESSRIAAVSEEERQAAIKMGEKCCAESGGSLIGWDSLEAAQTASSTLIHPPTVDGILLFYPLCITR